MPKKEEQKYNYIENILQEINAKHIALKETEKQRNSEILNTVLQKIIEKMRKNNLFDGLFRKEYYGGSYFDKLKVGKPDEYDLDLLLKLPTLTRPKLSASDEYPGYVQIHLENLEEYEKQDYAIIGFASKLLQDDNYLSTEKEKRWMKSVIHKALYEFPSGRSAHIKIISTPRGDFSFPLVSEGGPAFTLKLEGNVDGELVKFDVDLVPCFVFTDEKWPKPNFRPNPVQKKDTTNEECFDQTCYCKPVTASSPMTSQCNQPMQAPSLVVSIVTSVGTLYWKEFFVVPKRPDLSNGRDVSRYWRLSFQDQEGELIKDCQRLKPALRLIKRLRDVWDHKCISSYYIKTIFLWEVDNDETLFDKPLSYVFVTMGKAYTLNDPTPRTSTTRGQHASSSASAALWWSNSFGMLKKYKEALEKGEIPYYWNKKNNLIQKSKPITLSDFANKIGNVIKDIEHPSKYPNRVVRHFARPESASGSQDTSNAIIGDLHSNPSKETDSAATQKNSKSSWCATQ